MRQKLVYRDDAAVRHQLLEEWGDAVPWDPLLCCEPGSGTAGCDAQDLCSHSGLEGEILASQKTRGNAGVRSRAGVGSPPKAGANLSQTHFQKCVCFTHFI